MSVCARVEAGCVYLWGVRCCHDAARIICAVFSAFAAGMLRRNRGLPRAGGCCCAARCVLTGVLARAHITLRHCASIAVWRTARLLFGRVFFCFFSFFSIPYLSADDIYLESGGERSALTLLFLGILRNQRILLLGQAFRPGSSSNLYREMLLYCVFT